MNTKLWKWYTWNNLRFQKIPSECLKIRQRATAAHCSLAVCVMPYSKLDISTACRQQTFRSTCPWTRPDCHHHYIYYLDPYLTFCVRFNTTRFLEGSFHRLRLDDAPVRTDFQTARCARVPRWRLTFSGMPHLRKKEKRPQSLSSLHHHGSPWHDTSFYPAPHLHSLFLISLLIASFLSSSSSSFSSSSRCNRHIISFFSCT